ncbi:Uncharacterised protein [Mycobacteroides abscessus]|nr:Uncharacterised protein [Mycobacteroides abscessus]
MRVTSAPESECRGCSISRPVTSSPAVSTVPSGSAT